MDATKQPFALHLPKSVLIGLGLMILSANPAALAGTIVWGGASGTDTNWSNGANWNGAAAPAGGDDVKFFDLGAVAAPGTPNSLVDLAFPGYIGTLQFGSTNGVHTVSVAPGMTLNITNGNLVVGTPGDLGAAKNVTNTITGAGGALAINNTNAVIAVNQGSAASVSGTRGNLDLSGLDTFTANVRAIGLGSTVFPNPGNAVQREAGLMFLARTNYITLNLADTLANYQLPGRTNALELSRNPGNNGGILSILYLGQTNVFYVDSLGFGRDKASASSAGVMMFNPAVANNNPVAYFRGINGDASRVTWWAIADMNANGSSSQVAVGTNDFGSGTVDALVNVMSLGRDCNAAQAATAGNIGTLAFSNGRIDVNTLYVGNQSLGPSSPTTNFCAGVVNVNGAGALLNVNNSLVLGRTTQNTLSATNSRGMLNVRNGGTVRANTIQVGAVSVNNIITLTNATLIVTNTLATNAAGLLALSTTNSTLGLAINANGTLPALAKTLTTGGSTNAIQINNAAPVIFASYPQSFPLVKYTTWNGTNNFGLASVPAWLPGAMLVSNGVNGSLDLSIPTDPRPVFTSQPASYGGMPGDNVTSSFLVTIAAGSATPLGYQWYFVNSGVTNPLTDGAGPSGSSTLTGSATGNLQIGNAQIADSGSYFAVVTNLYGTNTSSLAQLLISTSPIPPTVTGPAALTATNGLTRTIGGSASGLPLPLIYWQFNGANLSDGPGPGGSSTISGSGTTTLTISNPQYPGDQGTYSLIASNSAGQATNNTVLTVLVPPVITNQPASQVVAVAQPASFTVVAGGVPAPTYQWYKNSLANPVSSAANSTATNATFTIASAAAADTATYFVVAQNPAGAVISASVTLTVNSTMSASTFKPANGALGVAYDTPLYVTFSQAPTLRTAGKISIYNVNNSSTPVDVIDLSQGVLQGRAIAGDTFTNYPVIITGNTAAIYPHLDLLTSNQTYYVTIDDGVFADATGAYFAGIAGAGTWQFTTKAGGPANPANLVVAQDYSGDFATVQGALDSLPANNSSLAYINLRNGTYTEIVEFKKGNVVLRGQSRSGTIVGYANNSTLNPNTHTRMAMKVNASNVSLDNLTVTNATAQDFSQAEALMVESGAAQVLVNNCNLDSYQDTILANTSTSKACFNNSLIQGDVDFIWGGGNLFFTNCEIRYLIRAGNSGALGPNPSPSASDISSNGFSFVNCRFTTLPGANPNDTIGRTRSITNGNTALINCLISTNIGGWSSDALPTANFRNWYYNCTNDLGAPVTLSNGIALSPGDPNITLSSSAAAWLYGWSPALSPNLISQPASQSATAGQPVAFISSATGIPAPVYQWFKNGTNLPGATSGTLSIAGAQRSDAGTYYVVASNGSGSVTSSVVTLTYLNSAPVAPNFAMGALLGTPSTVQIVGGKYTPTDADGDALTITGLTGGTNGTVSTDGISATYTPTNGTGDAFTYTVSDGFGGTTSATVTVYISSNMQGYNLLSAASLGGGTTVLSFAGIPTYNYALDLATNLQPPINWMPQATNPAANNGLLVFTNTSAAPQSFYRTRYVP